jgi:hypothetical protein
VKFSIGGLDFRQGAKYAKFRREKINYLEKNAYYFPIFAAFASLREMFRVSLVAISDKVPTASDTTLGT